LGRGRVVRPSWAVEFRSGRMNILNEKMFSAQQNLNYCASLKEIK
jgi:hypothetical protein